LEVNDYFKDEVTDYNNEKGLAYAFSQLEHGKILCEIEKDSEWGRNPLRKS